MRLFLKRPVRADSCRAHTQVLPCLTSLHPACFWPCSTAPDPSSQLSFSSFQTRNHTRHGLSITGLQVCTIHTPSRKPLPSYVTLRQHPTSTQPGELNQVKAARPPCLLSHLPIQSHQGAQDFPQGSSSPSLCQPRLLSLRSHTDPLAPSDQHSRVAGPGCHAEIKDNPLSFSKYPPRGKKQSWLLLKMM